MAYVALRPMTAWGEGGSIALAPGDTVPDFLKLKGSVRQALLRSMYVQDTDDARNVPTPSNGSLRMMPATWEPKEETFKGSARKLLTCPHCDHPGFATISGRRKHVTSNHVS